MALIVSPNLPEVIVGHSTSELSDRWTPGERFWAALVTVGVVGTALVPLRQYRRPIGERTDGFPMSYYPMFSARRGQFGHVTYAVGVTEDGGRRNLPYDVLGTGGVNQVRKQLSRAVRRGEQQAHADRLAAAVALHPDHTDLRLVEIVRGQFDLDDCLTNGHARGAETVLASAQVMRP